MINKIKFTPVDLLLNGLSIARIYRSYIFRTIIGDYFIKSKCVVDYTKLQMVECRDKLVIVEGALKLIGYQNHQCISVFWDSNVAY